MPIASINWSMNSKLVTPSKGTGVIVPDVNLLIYTYNSDATNHTAARRAARLSRPLLLGRLLSAGHSGRGIEGTFGRILALAATGAKAE